MKTKQKAKAVIKAECHSDDHKAEVDFDAVKWFRQATNKEILDLAGCDWGGDYPADDVARFFEESSTKRLFDYLSFKPTMPYSGDVNGFECHVDSSDAMRWLKKKRPSLYEKLKVKI